MSVQLVHPFVNRIPNVDEWLLADNDEGVVCSINSFCAKVKKLAAQYSDHIDESKFKGDALEVLAEYICKTNSTDNRVGIYEYRPTTDPDDDDWGVDGVGVGENGNVATVQVKFRRGDYTLLYDADHLGNFVAESWGPKYRVSIDDDNNMLIITTAKDVEAQAMEKGFGGKVRVLNREALRIMFDNRPEWWKQFYEAVKESRQDLEKKEAPWPRREHQEEAFRAIWNDDNFRGKIILPTGTGKTLLEADVALELIHRCAENGNFSPVIQVNSSRILLCFQLFEEFFSRFRSFGVEARYVNYNSGNKDDAEYARAVRKEGWTYRKIASTTSYAEVQRIRRQCQKEHIPLLIFSTYHSAEKLSLSGIVSDLTIHDEAHNLVARNFCRAASLPTNGSLFFTATEKITDSEDGLGMNNGDVFDNIIYTKSANELIAAGEMVAPWVHVVRSTNSNLIDTDYDEMFRSIMEAFHAHERKIKEVSYAPSQVGAKVLVVCRGQQDILEMLTTKRIEQFQGEFPDIHLFALCSDYGMLNDGEFHKPPVTNVKKHQLIKAMKSLASHERALVFHVDMIGEGIDVPGITGVMPFRNCEESKLIQNIGRSSRLHPIDRTLMYAGELDPQDKFRKWIKPYSWVIIPSYMVDTEGLEARFRYIVGKLRDEFGFIPQQHTVIDNPHGLDDEDDIDAVNEKDKSRPRKKSELDGYTHEFEKITIMEQIAREYEQQKLVGDILAEIDGIPL